MIEKRVRDLRLDSRLRSTCENEIFNMCAFQGVRLYLLNRACKSMLKYWAS
jgi:hypothetical protein